MTPEGYVHHGGVTQGQAAGKAAGTGSWEPTSSNASTKHGVWPGSGSRLLVSKSAPSDTVPPGKLHYLPKHCHQLETSVQIHETVGGASLIQTTAGRTGLFWLIIPDNSPSVRGSHKCSITCLECQNLGVCFPENLIHADYKSLHPPFLKLYWFIVHVTHNSHMEVKSQRTTIGNPFSPSTVGSKDSAQVTRRIWKALFLFQTILTAL